MRPSSTTTPSRSPRRWQEAGATRIHVVDLDGAREGVPRNEDVIHRILVATEVPVQVGGGNRDIAVIQRYLDAGADRVALGTAAVKDQMTLVERRLDLPRPHLRRRRRA